MTAQKVLIVGAGVSGSIVAYWLGRNDFEVLVIERSRANQKAGQGIEIEEPALQVVQAMDIMNELEAVKTGEKGFKLRDETGHVFASFEAGPASVTGNLEMMRGDLVEVLYKAANQSPNVTYEFETTISSITQNEKKCSVTLSKRRDEMTRTEDFDYVIGADGVKSKTRALAMGSNEELQCSNYVGMVCAYFSIPRASQDTEYSELCNYPGRRIIWTRPVSKDSSVTSVYLIHLAGHIAELREANETGDRTKQKEVLARIFRGLGGEAPRVIEGMLKADNFYSDDLQQIKLKTWSKNRVALVGDSAWAPTPVTGEGNQLAIMGAWVLAQEMTRERSPLAFKNYEQRLRKYVEQCQNIPLGGYAPYIFNPETRTGIWVLRNVMRVLSSVVKVFMWTNLGRFFPDTEKNAFDLQIPAKEN